MMSRDEATRDRCFEAVKMLIGGYSDEITQIGVHHTKGYVWAGGAYDEAKIQQQENNA